MFRNLLQCGAVVAIALLCGGRSFGSMLYSTPSGTITETDNSANLPVEATVAFSISGTTLTVTVTNLESDTFMTSQNISAVAFQIFDGSSFLGGTFGSTTTPGASVNLLDDGGASNLSINQAFTPVAASVSWNAGNLSTLAGHAFGAGNVSGGGNNVALGTNAFILSSAATGISDALYTVVGGPNGSGVYDGAPDSCAGTGPQACNTGEPIVDTNLAGYTKNTSALIEQTATFAITIPGLNGANDTIQNVHLGFGPDGPDTDDWVAAQFTPTPEPASLVLVMAGLSVMGWKVRRRGSNVH